MEREGYAEKDVSGAERHELSSEGSDLSVGKGNSDQKRKEEGSILPQTALSLSLHFFLHYFVLQLLLSVVVQFFMQSD